MWWTKLSTNNDTLEKEYNKEKEESMRKLLQSSLVYVLKTRDFDGENYYMEDITAILADYQTLILSFVNELIDESFNVMREFGDKFSYFDKGSMKIQDRFSLDCKTSLFRFSLGRPEQSRMYISVFSVPRIVQPMCSLLMAQFLGCRLIRITTRERILQSLWDSREMKQIWSPCINRQELNFPSTLHINR